MAEIAATAVPSLASVEPPANNRITGLVAGAVLRAGDACYINANGTVFPSSGAAVAAAAKVHGWAAMAAAIGDGITLFFDVNLRYAAALVPGTSYFLSATNPGGLSDTATTGGTGSIAFAVDATRLHVMLSRY
jgi:hypothetical protein